MSTWAKVGLTRTISMAVVVGMAALAGAAELGDGVSAQRALAARFSRTQMAAQDASSSAASGSGFANAYGGSKADAGYFLTQVGNNYVFWGTTQSFGLGLLNPWLTELDGNGNLVLQQVWGTAQTETGTVNPTPDGGFFVSLVSQPTPGKTVLQLVKLNSSLTSVWQKQYGTGSEGLAGAVVLNDNSFLIEGSTVQVSGSTMTYVGTLIKTDSSGNILWQKQSSSAQPVTLYFGQLADGSYIGVGITYAASNPADTDILVVKLDSSGNVSWQKSYGGSGGSSAYSALAISGGYLIAGSTTAFGAGKQDVWLLQLDTSGNLVKQETVGSTGNDVALIRAVSGGYLLSGYTDASGSSDGWLAFLDSNLNVTSSRTYGGSGADELFALADSTGGFLLMGTTSSFGGGGKNAWVVKTDASGNPVWQNAYGGTGVETGEIARLSGGGLMLSGTTTSWGAGATDMLAALLGSTGQLAGCNMVHPTSVTPATFAVTTSATSVTPVTTTIAVTNATVTASTISLSPTTTAATVTEICGATSALTATASANTTSGTAPLSVNFTGAASGGTSPYTYSWNFGDGSAQSTQQDPTHSYSAAGSYAVVLKVTDAASATATDSHLDISVSSATCTLTCQASVPATGTVGVAVSFTSSATATNCGGTVGYLWNFGDGQTSTAQNPTHAYTQAQTYSWTLAVTSGTGTCNQSGSITISSAGAQQTWIPVGSHASGLNSSQWRSDLGLLNTGTASATVQITGYIGSSVLTKSVTVAAGAESILTDVVGQLGGSGSGALEVSSAQLLKVTERTYNQVSSTASCYPNGTQGQDYPAVVTSGGLSAGQSAYLAGLTEDSSYRTNVGVVNTGTAAASVLVKLYNGTGTYLAEYTVPLTAGEWAQTTQPFKNDASQTAMTAGYATITVQSGSGVFGFASVIDNSTNDPTTVAMQKAASAVVAWVPVASHASGLNSSQWRSDVGLLNPGTAPATVQIQFYGSGGVVSKSTSVAAGAQSILTDVVGWLGGSGSGALEVTSTQPLLVTERTYNQVSSTASCYPNGTQGQDYPAVVTSGGLSSGQSAYLAGLTEDSSYRSNVGVVNTGTAAASVLVKLYNGAGTYLADYTVPLTAGQWAQTTQPFKNDASQTAMTAGYATITVQSGSGVFAFASVIDNSTNDPTTVAMQR